jgi:nucleotide-binding universal stress UspA family protein
MSNYQPLPAHAPAARAPARILAAVDYSDIANLVVAEAAALASQKQAAQLHFLHTNPAFTNPLEQELRHRELLEWLAPRLNGVPGLAQTRLVAHEQSGNAAHLILEMARDLAIDLVVVGTHNRKGIQRLVLGSVASEVIHKCSCPVFVVRQTVHEQAAPSIEPPCSACLEVRQQSGGEILWCDQHLEKHGRRHTYYDPHSSSWVSQRMLA